MSRNASPLAFCVVLLAASGLAGCKAEAQPPRPSLASQVVVTDGDTIRVRGERVRLSNIDAPELPPHAKCWAEAALSLQAAREAEWLVASAKSVELEREGRDRYGRTLARVTLDGKDMGEALVNLGVAARWTGRRWSWCAPADYMDSAGPSMWSGPENNEAYATWLNGQVLAEARRDNPGVIDPWRPAQPAPGRAARQGH